MTLPPLVHPAGVVLPLTFYFDHRFARVRKRAKKRRIFLEILCMMCFEGNYRQIQLSPKTWLSALGVSAAWFEPFIAELVEDRVCTWEEDGTLTFCEWVWEPPAWRALAEPMAAAPRQRYPSDERRKERSNGHSAEDSADTPQPLRTDSATEPAHTPQGTPQAPSIDIESIDIDRSNQESDSSIDSIDSIDRSKEAQALIVEQMVAYTITPKRAKVLIGRHGLRRCAEVLASVPQWHPEAPGAAIEKALHQGPRQWPAKIGEVNGGLQTAMVLLGMIAGGKAETAPPKRPPLGVSPPREVIDQARQSVRRQAG